MIEHTNRLQSFGVGDARRELVPQARSDGLSLYVEGVETFEIAWCGCATNWVLGTWSRGPAWFGWMRVVTHRRECPDR